MLKQNLASRQEFERVLDAQYTILEEIGVGTFSVVWRACEKNTGNPVAIKHVQVNKDGKVPARALREAKFVSNFGHENVIRLLDVHVAGTNVPTFFVYELLMLDLHTILYRKHGFLLSVHDIARYAYDIISGMEAVHDQQIVHRDLKPTNICVSADGTAKISGFGAARNNIFSSKVCTRDVTTLSYRAPEIILGAEECGFSVDLWALGCVFAEMIMGSPFFPGSSEIGMLFVMFQKLGTPSNDMWPGVETYLHWKHSLPNFPVPSLEQHINKRPEVGAAGFDFMLSFLQYYPDRRATAQCAKQHPFLEGAR